jgi:hypothetical protein
MIVVTGTKRSGTSLWMQILERTGFRILGEKFPADWQNSIIEANPNGFWESKFREGINWTTNPTEGGVYCSPEATKNFAVKVFMAGIVRTDIAYLDKVIVTVRHWAEYGRSLDRLNALEDQYLCNMPAGEAKANRLKSKALLREKTLPPEIEWFFENLKFLKDYNLRKYNCQLTAYDDLVGDPEKTLQRVFPWLGFGKVEVGLGAIDDALRGRKITRPEVQHPYAEIFEDFYNALAKASVPKALVEKLNETSAKLKEEYGLGKPPNEPPTLGG